MAEKDEDSLVSNNVTSVTGHKTHVFPRIKLRSMLRSSTRKSESNDANVLEKKTKTNKERMRLYRQRIKSCPELQELYRKVSNERNRAYRANLSEEKRLEHAEKTRLRVQKLRAKRKLEFENTKDNSELQNSKPKTRKQCQKLREKWCSSKQKQRENMTSQKRRRVNEKRRMKYAAKQQCKNIEGAESQTADTIPKKCEIHIDTGTGSEREDTIAKRCEVRLCAESKTEDTVAKKCEVRLGTGAESQTEDTVAKKCEVHLGSGAETQTEDTVAKKCEVHLGSGAETQTEDTVAKKCEVRLGTGAETQTEDTVAKRCEVCLDNDEILTNVSEQCTYTEHTEESGKASKEARRKAAYRAKSQVKQSIPSSPRTFAKFVTSLAKTTPRKRKALESEGIMYVPPSKRKLILQDDDESIQMIKKELNENRKKRSYEHLRRRRLLMNVVHKTINNRSTSTIRKQMQDCGVSWNFFTKASNLEGVWEEKQEGHNGPISLT